MSAGSPVDVIDQQLDAIHEACSPSEGSCWCCCMICTENDDTEELREQYWRLVIKSDQSAGAPVLPGDPDE